MNKNHSLRVRSVGIVIVLMMAVGCPGKGPSAPEVGPAHVGAVDHVDPDRLVSGHGEGDATLLFLGDVHGVLRPCGCTVDLQKGGFDRLVPLLVAERTRHPGALLLHAGSLFFEDAEVSGDKSAQRTRQAEVVADLTAAAQIDVVGVSVADVVASSGKYTDLLSRSGAQPTVANLRHPQLDHIPRRLVRRVDGLEVAIFALADPEDAPFLQSGRILDPVESARKMVAELSAISDVVILLSDLGLRQTKRLLRKVPGIDFAVAAGLGEDPIFNDEAEVVGQARVLQLHREGRYLGRLSAHRVAGDASWQDASAPSASELKSLEGRIIHLKQSIESWQQGASATDKQMRSARHHLTSLESEHARLQSMGGKPAQGRSHFSCRVTPLNWDLPQDPIILKIMGAFDLELKEIALANVGTLPPLEPGQATYVGVDECLSCHDEAQTFWDEDRHHKAWATLEKDKKTFDAECVSCHVTGYGRAGGSLVGLTQGREDVQCEACHGPGSLHVEADDDRLKTTITRVPSVDTCTACHNKHHSPHFDDRIYRDKLMVPGHGKALSSP